MNMLAGTLACNVLYGMVNEETWRLRKQEYGTQSAKNKEVMASKRARQVDDRVCNQGIKVCIKVQIVN